MKYWTTREGKCIAIKDMTNKHLMNTINFLYHRLDEIYAITRNKCHGFDDLEVLNEAMEEATEALKSMECEAKERGLLYNS